MPRKAIDDYRLEYLNEALIFRRNPVHYEHYLSEI